MRGVTRGQCGWGHAGDAAHLAGLHRLAVSSVGICPKSLF